MRSQRVGLGDRADRRGRGEGEGYPVRASRGGARARLDVLPLVLSRGEHLVAGAGDQGRRRGACGVPVDRDAVVRGRLHPVVRRLRRRVRRHPGVGEIEGLAGLVPPGRAAAETPVGDEHVEDSSGAVVDGRAGDLRQVGDVAAVHRQAHDRGGSLEVGAEGDGRVDRLAVQGLVGRARVGLVVDRGRPGRAGERPRPGRARADERRRVPYLAARRGHPISRGPDREVQVLPVRVALDAHLQGVDDAGARVGRGSRDEGGLGDEAADRREGDRSRRQVGVVREGPRGQLDSGLVAGLVAGPGAQVVSRVVRPLGHGRHGELEALVQGVEGSVGRDGGRPGRGLGPGPAQAVPVIGRSHVVEAAQEHAHGVDAAARVVEGGARGKGEGRAGVQAVVEARDRRRRTLGRTGLILVQGEGDRRRRHLHAGGPVLGPHDQAELLAGKARQERQRAGPGAARRAGEMRRVRHGVPVVRARCRIDDASVLVSRQAVPVALVPAPGQVGADPVKVEIDVVDLAAVGTAAQVRGRAPDRRDVGHEAAIDDPGDGGGRPLHIVEDGRRHRA